MDSSDIRHRKAVPAPNGEVRLPLHDALKDPPERQEKGVFMQIVRLLLFTTWFVGTCSAAHMVQLLGAPLYWIHRDYYYAWMALTKQSFGLIITTITQWFSPTDIRVSGDKSIPGQLRLTKGGRLITDFPERMVLIANHQLYTDWLYLWWIAYTSNQHGHIFIILRENLKYIPIIGPGMMFYGFIFMARKWQQDQSRMEHRLKQLKTQHAGPLSGSKGFDPMWLLLFPEGIVSERRKGIS
jgi:Acyltransferase